MICIGTYWCTTARANDYYVAVDGADTNAGTKDKPFATIERAQMGAAPGDTVYIRGGTYKFSGTQATVGVSFTKSGQSGKPIQYFASPGEVPIFDLFDLKPQERVTGLDVRCNWIHIRGLEVRGVRQLIVGDSWGVRVRGDHNVIEALNVHDNEAPGIFITSGTANLIVNCDSHHNYDPLEDGGNADGFGCHSSGGDNVLRGCRAWENSDDGFDFINAAGVCIVEESWSFRNGWVPDTNMGIGNGAGFKSGGFGLPPNTPASGAPRHVVRKNVAFANRSIGFYANYHPGGIDFLNNTAIDNPANFDMRPPSADFKTSHTLRNNVAAMPGKPIVSLNGGTDDNNSWTLQVTVSDADFLSVDRAQALQPREADGSLPRVDFMHLAEGSDLIDRGVDVSLPFTGKAPDLGAYEWGETAPVTPADGGVAGSGMPPAADGGRAGIGSAGTAPSGAVSAAGRTGSAGARSGTVMDAGMSPQEPTAAGAAAAAAGRSGMPASAGAAAMPAAGADDSTDGCGCRAVVASSPRPPLVLFALATALVWVARRRRQRR